MCVRSASDPGWTQTSISLRSSMTQYEAMITILDIYPLPFWFLVPARKFPLIICEILRLPYCLQCQYGLYWIMVNILKFTLAYLKLILYKYKKHAQHTSFKDSVAWFIVFQTAKWKNKINPQCLTIVSSSSCQWWTFFSGHDIFINNLYHQHSHNKRWQDLQMNICNITNIRWMYRKKKK